MSQQLRPTFGAPPRPRRGPPRRLWLHGLLFLATLASTTFAGSFAHALLRVDTWGELILAYLRSPQLVLEGLPFSLLLLSILGAHEMGHYAACRRYGIPATLPFFLPGPPPFGTFGAVIRIRGTIPDRRSLFDVAAAGPIAGYVVALPVFLAGVLLEGRPTGIWLIGDPWLLSFVVESWSPDAAASPATDYYLAGWFGMLITSMNLFPVGQLDGGHAAYAVSRKLHRRLSYGTLLALLVLIVVQPMRSGAPSLYTVWFLVLVWLRDRHPPLRDESVALGSGRMTVGALLVLIFLASFIPRPLFLF